MNEEIETGLFGIQQQQKQQQQQLTIFSNEDVF